MPAAAVIPAPRAYINVVAVKKPVVGFEDIICVTAPRAPVLGFPETHYGNVLLARGFGCRLFQETWIRSRGTSAVVTVSKTECSRQPTRSVEC